MGLFFKKKETAVREDAVKFVSNFHLDRARKADKENDYTTAAREYRKTISILKKDNPEEFRTVSEEFENFVKRDPIFKEILSVFLSGIKEHPEIKPIDISLGGITKDWGEIYGLGRALEPIDIKYFFDFAEKFGYIKIENDTGKIHIQNKNKENE
jgi:RecA/RadA recombinase